MKKAIRRGCFRSKNELKKKIFNFIYYFNETMPNPWKWTYQGKVLNAWSVARYFASMYQFVFLSNTPIIPFRIMGRCCAQSWCSESAYTSSSLLSSIFSRKCRKYTHGRFRHPASCDTDTSTYSIGIRRLNSASAAYGCANAVIAWLLSRCPIITSPSCLPCCSSSA